MKLKNLLKVFILVILIGVFASCGKKEEKKSLIMGLVPIANSEKLLEDVEPLYKMLGDNIGIDVDGYIATNYIGMVEALGTGTIDFALIPPFAYILANTKNGSEALLTSIGKHNEPGYYSVLVVRKNSGINKVEDLKGKKIAFVDPSSTSGYIFPAVILKDHGIDTDKDIIYQFAGGHDKAIQLLVNGDVDAIGTYENALTKFSKEFSGIEDELKVLEKSDLIPGITLTVSSKIDDETKQKIKDAFLKITTTDEGKNLTLKLFGIKGFEEANSDNYNLIKEKLDKMGIDIEKIK